MPIVYKYPLPAFLKDMISPSEYSKWLNCKADTLHKLDLKRKKPWAGKCSKAVYKEEIHKAVLFAGTKDPYTGDTLRWDLIGKWDNKKEALYRLEQVRGVFNREFFLLPTVDHSDPYNDVLEFEICSWIVNSSKTLMNPDEFVGFCKKIAEFPSTLRPGSVRRSAQEPSATLSHGDMVVSNEPACQKTPP
jgi:hypothetical protein